MKACALLFLCGILFLLTGCNGASEAARQQLDKFPDHGFLTKTLHRGIWTRKYAVYIPKSYHAGTAQKYPVIIFLHGVGEGSGLGEGDLKQLTVGLGPFVAEKANRGEAFDFIVIFPQSDGNWGPDSDYTRDMFTALANTAREYPTDPDRIYLTGLSTGGAGTWAIGAKYHENFAALVPMGSNGSSLDQADKLTHVSVRAYCSMFGDMFAGFNDHMMVGRIKDLNPGANATFISTPTLGHDCWENVYGGTEFYDWLKQQRRASGTGLADAVPARAEASFASPAPSMPPAAPVTPVRAATPLQPVAQSAMPAAAAPPAPPTPPAVPASVAPAPVSPPRPAASSTSGDWVNTPW
jgi:predicted esterase